MAHAWQRELDARLMVYIYEGSPLFLAQVTPPANLSPSSKINLQATIHWEVCSNETCLPETDTTVALNLPVAADPQFEKEFKPLLDQARAALPQPAAMLNVTAPGGRAQIARSAWNPKRYEWAYPANSKKTFISFPQMD